MSIDVEKEEPLTLEKPGRVSAGQCPHLCVEHKIGESEGLETSEGTCALTWI